MTRQFARSIEIAIAEFADLNDLQLFLDSKLTLDESQNVVIIYRVFDDNTLLHTLNMDRIKVPIYRAQYAEGNTYLPDPCAHPYKINSRSMYGLENLIARFVDLNDAKVFVNDKLITDATQKQKMNYDIFDEDKLLETLDQSKMIVDDAQSGTQEKGKKVTFRPTPFQMTLRLGPSKWLKDEDENEGEEGE